ncbi:hypothetical protein CC2G_001413 [Coprinopsis cinerea AmutBmut pab1-1]|nr:hypothetical protein CC2G_001413 [Coprinopsis cinerea AmutBmut pab1-1]
MDFIYPSHITLVLTTLSLPPCPLPPPLPPPPTALSPSSLFHRTHPHLVAFVIPPVFLNTPHEAHFNFLRCILYLLACYFFIFSFFFFFATLSQYVLHTLVSQSTLAGSGWN